MPDPNKFAKLREIGYVIRDCCDNCRHGLILSDAKWGTCKIHHYEHARQSNPKGGREISIHRVGWCPSFVRDPTRSSHYEAHAEFLED